LNDKITIYMKSTFNSRSVLSFNIITLYFDCTLAIAPNVSANNLMQHMVLVPPIFDFEKMKSFHHLRDPYVSKHIKLGFRTIIIIWDNSLKIKILKSNPLKRIYYKLIFWITCLKMKCSYNYPWGKYVFGFLKILNWLFEMNISIQKHKGIIFSKHSCVLMFIPN
jgi:hypothetical protein